MQLAIAVDGLLGKPSTHLQDWLEKGLAKENVTKNESYWATMPAYDDVKGFAKGILELIHAGFIEPPLFLAERPKALLTVTRAWLRAQGFSEAEYGQVVCQTIKRYDCRLYAVDVLLDSDRAMLQSFQFDTTIPYHIDRTGEGPIMNGIVKNFEDLGEALENVIWSINSH